MPRLTVLICTHDRVGLLEKTLASLDAVRRPPGWSVDVLVAANACSDGTHAYLETRSRGASGADALPLAWFTGTAIAAAVTVRAMAERVAGSTSARP